MENHDFGDEDEELTIGHVSTAVSEETLVPDSESDLGYNHPCYFLTMLPIELRKNIYRYFCISDYDRTSHPRLWRPSGYEGSWGKIGYFERGTVIPLLSLCRQIHDEAATVLYGENLFAFHVSELSQGPILFFAWLAPKYVQLLRKVHIRSGFDVDKHDTDPIDCGIIHQSLKRTKLSSDLNDFRAVKNLLLSAAIIKQAWPEGYKARINKTDTLSYSNKDNVGLQRKCKAIDWPAGSFHLWKLVIPDHSMGKFQPEFRRTKLAEEGAE